MGRCARPSTPTHWSTNGSPTRPRGDAGELARRFFVGHGPASVKDFARWSSLTLGQATDAVDAVAGRLQSSSTSRALRTTSARTRPIRAADAPALLLPLYDELTLSYPMINFPVAAGHPHRPGEDLFVGSVIVDEHNVGTWRRTLQAKVVQVEIPVAPGVADDDRARIARAAQRLAGFLGRDLQLRDLDRV